MVLTWHPILELTEVVAEAARAEEDGRPVWSRGDALRTRIGEEAAADYLRRLSLAA
ncbi:hypothetical protein ACFVP0_29035 [Streptomyces cinereoruber]|uniref:hypothetical protein n=1 Tax=Streptomyces cinereoruber TaxID=67260 RepID=UPI003696099F